MSDKCSQFSSFHLPNLSLRSSWKITNQDPQLANSYSWQLWDLELLIRNFDFRFLLTYLIKSFFLSDTAVVSVDSSWPLAFLVFFLKVWTAALYYPCEARPCFQGSSIFISCPCSRQYSLFRQAYLLPCLLDLWHRGTACSCSCFWKVVLEKWQSLLDPLTF